MMYIYIYIYMYIYMRRLRGKRRLEADALFIARAPQTLAHAFLHREDAGANALCVAPAGLALHALAPLLYIYNIVQLYIHIVQFDDNIELVLVQLVNPWLERSLFKRTRHVPYSASSGCTLCDLFKQL